MKGSSFGVIYNAFEGFERHMEDALDGIFDEDVPPSVTAVAASVTQSYQSIIGCDNTRIFMDDKKMKPGLSFDDKNVIAEPTWSLDGFEHTRHEIGKQRTKYYCKNNRHKDCKCNATLDFHLVDGIADTNNPIRIGRHSRGCCFKMGVNTELYEWEGKEDFEPVSKVVEVVEVEKENSHPNIPMKRPKQALDVKQEMKICISVLAVSNMTWLLKQVYDTCRADIDEKYPSGWCGIQYNTVIDLIRNTRRQLNFGDAISTVENTTLDYYQMTDNERSFLQVSMTSLILLLEKTQFES